MNLPDILSQKLDQNETEALFAQVNIHEKRLRAIILRDRGETVQPPTFPAGACIFDKLEILSAHVTVLEKKLGDAAPKFESSLRPAGSPLLHEPSRGSASLNIGGGFLPGAKSSKPRENLTAKILAARGVKTLAELDTKMANTKLVLNGPND